mmetsp:Transcript_2623/g.4110  ORF Transcript_2623/g.4110 Transcript_2623/m.4110 type:complete len:296 (+) Transcript_2623:58-945(+)
MKTSLFCNVFFLLASIGSAASNVEVSNALETELALDADYEVDAERELLTKKERLAKKEAKKAKKAKRAAKKAARQAAKKAAKTASEPELEPYEPYEPEPVPAPAPRNEAPEIMYKEIIYMEQACTDYLAISLNGTVEDDTDTIQLGDTRSFKCELFETAIQYGQFGGRKVGDTFWYCRAFAFDSVNIVFTRQEFVVWDCTIVDYIGEDEEEDTTLRNEGLAVQIDRPDLNRDDAIWKEFHSHTGTFATVGGIIAAKGARGQVEVEWDDFRQTWYHVYTIEVWALEQTPILPFAIP